MNASFIESWHRTLPPFIPSKNERFAGAGDGVLSGVTYFSTNQPVSPSTCGTSLGVARGYGVSSLDASTPNNIDKFTLFAGGGLPPSPVAGVASILVTNAAGTTTPVNVPFVIGGGGQVQNGSAPPTANCGATGFDVCAPPVGVTGVRGRVYWYIQQ